MHVTFKYSRIEEVKNIFEIFFHVNEYKNLRSVVFPSLVSIAEILLYSDNSAGEYRNLWGSVEPKFNDAILSSGLTSQKYDVVCFTHKFGCEGWFNIEKKQIHVRTSMSTNKNTTDTIMHELLHLITYTPTLSYEEREALVDKYMKMHFFQDILLSV